MSVLEVKNLTKIYKNDKLNVEVLKDINLNIENGEFVFITGPSGSGKTTLLNCISGLEKISGGAIYIDGVNLANITNKEMANLRRTKVGFVFQAFNLLPNLTIYENVAIAAIIAGDEKKERILNLLEKFGLLEYKNYYPS